MNCVEIIKITPLFENHHEVKLFRLKSPNVGQKQINYVLNIEGAVMGKKAPIKKINILFNNNRLRRVPVNLSSNSIALKHPKLPWADAYHFHTAINVLGLGERFEIRLEAVSKGGKKFHLCNIEGHHAPLDTGFHARLQPIVLNALGRSGTTWFMRLFSMHPEIVAHDIHPYENFIAHYWIRMFRVLAQPANPVESMGRSELRSENSAYIGQNPLFHKHQVSHPQLFDWLSGDYINQLAAFCQSSIDQFYSQVAQLQDKSQAKFFMEKHGPNSLILTLWDLYPHTKEIVLVRDFRDMFCSSRAFNRKRGFDSFGRQHVETDHEWIQSLHRGAERLLKVYKQRSERVHLVKYESLILEPQATMQGILDYIGLDSSDACIRSMLEQASKDTPELKTHRTSKDPKRSIGRWRQDLEEPIKSDCNRVFGDILSQFGYD